MMHVARRLARLLGSAARDLLPLVAVVILFQSLVIGEPFPDVVNVLTGLIFVVIGLALFIRGLEMGLFPLGEAMAGAFIRKGHVGALLAFAFTLGFGTTIAEPALIAIADEAARAAAAAGIVVQTDIAAEALRLRLVVALSVGTAIVVGVLRILRGWSITTLIVGGYLLVVALTPLAPTDIVAVAYDSGGVTTSTVTVPLVTALGVGLAQTIRGRNPVVDGFGLIAFASLMPVIFVLVFGILSRL